MSLFRGIGAFDDGTAEAPGIGAAPLDVRKDLAGLFASAGGISVRAGILPGASTALVTGTATMAYGVGAFHAVGSRGASDGAQLFGNDGGLVVGTTGVGTTVPAAPGAGLSRIDIVWIRHPTNAENADTSSIPLIGVESGIAASSPVAPSIPVGALELARNTMTSTATTTASAGNTISQTFPWTALRGSPIPVRNVTERDALFTYDGAKAYRIDLDRVESHNGTAWSSENSVISFTGSGGQVAGAAYDSNKPIRRHYVRGNPTCDAVGILYIATPAGCSSVLYVSPVVELAPTGSSACTLVVRPVESSASSIALQMRNTSGTGAAMPAGSQAKLGVEIVYQI